MSRRWCDVIVVACYVAAAYLTVSAAIVASCLLATALPAWIAVLAGIAWGPVMAWCVIEAAWDRLYAKWIAWRKR